MNGNPKNRNVAPPKQINRIAAPIQVTPPTQTPNNQIPQQVNTVGNPQVMRVNTGVQNPQVVAPQAPVSALAQAAQNQSIRGNNAKKKTFVKLEHDPSTMIFVTILLIILAVLCAFIFYVILPRIEANKKEQPSFNDGTTTTISPVVEKTSTINSIRINNGNAITSSGNYTVDNNFNITTTSNMNGGIDVSVNNTKVTSTKKILGTIGRVDDLIIMALSDGDIRNNRLVIYDKNGSLKKEIRGFEGTDGMLLTDEVNGYIFTINNIILLASRIYDNKVILSNDAGSVDGLDICNKELLLENSIGDSFMVISSYSLTYKGNNEFSDPFSVNNVTLLEYRDSNNLCR